LGAAGLKTHKSKKTGKLVYEFDERSLTGIYYPAPDCAFNSLCKSAKIIGFPKLPKGFSTDGYGFATPAGTYLTAALRTAFGDGIYLSIARTATSEARKLKMGWRVTLNHSDYLRILDPLRDIRHERNVKSNAHVAHILSQLFPRQFKQAEAVSTIYTYEEDKISKMLAGLEDAHERLSKADVELIARLNASLVKDQKIGFHSITIAEESKRQNERIYLQSVIDEFRKRLANKALSEADWQRFLQRYILLFNTSYVDSIEKLSVDLRGKYPDFLLVNVYGYIDIFEIKKPSTNLLRHDDSRDNYYWDTEVAKAISQTEKYIQMLIKKDLEVRDIIQEKCGLEVKVVRPRGFIVVGGSAQFANSKMNDDFRLLAASLKNVDVILYDELLGNLENLLARLKKRPTRHSTRTAGPRRARHR
jgi:hypothetical protein